MRARPDKTLRKEADVLRCCVEWFERDGSFTASEFFVDRDGEAVDVTSPEIVATCAIGGVEHAVWRVMGADVYEHRGTLAHLTDEREVPHDGATEVYGRVMCRLNRIAVEKFNAANVTIEDVEDVTQVGTLDEAYENMMSVFRAALDEVLTPA